MGNFDVKTFLLNQIAALNAINNFPILDKNNTNLFSLNSQNNTLDFLIELIKVLTGWERIKTETVNFLTYNLSTIESSIKILLRNLMKKYFVCATDGLIPDTLINDGFNVAIKQIDFFDLLRIDPNDPIGKLLYGSEQKDLNHLLHSIINSSNSGSWRDIIVITYLETGLVDGKQFNEILNIKIHPDYSGKTVNEFINDFITAINILILPLLINRILDNLFGIITGSINNNSLKKIEEQNAYIEKIIDLPDTIIDNSYFDFNLEEVNQINGNVERKFNSEYIFKNCNNIAGAIKIENVQDLFTKLENETEFVNIKTILDNQFDVLLKDGIDGLDNADKSQGLLELYADFFRGIILGIANLLTSPKVILFFITYFKIINKTIGFITFKEFIIENKEFFTALIREVIMPIVIEFLIKLILKILKQLIIQNSVGDKAEKIKYYQTWKQTYQTF
jgi:hypothetical protein